MEHRLWEASGLDAPQGACVLESASPFLMLRVPNGMRLLASIAWYVGSVCGTYAVSKQSARLVFEGIPWHVFSVMELIDTAFLAVRDSLFGCDAPANSRRQRSEWASAYSQSRGVLSIGIQASQRRHSQEIHLAHSLINSRCQWLELVGVHSAWPAVSPVLAGLTRDSS